MAPKEPQRILAVTRQALSRDAATARAQVRDTRVPLLEYTDRSPRAWAIHGAERCWARPKTVHGLARPGSRCILTPHPSRLPQVARVERGVVGRGVRDVGGVRGAEPRRHASRRNKGDGSRLLHKWGGVWRGGSGHQRGGG